MGSTTAIPKTPYSGLGKFITLVGYSSVLSKDYLKPGDLYQRHDIPHHDWPTPNRAPSFSGSCVGVIEYFGKLWIDLSAAKNVFRTITKELIRNL